MFDLRSRGEIRTGVEGCHVAGDEKGLAEHEFCWRCVELRLE
jgi:hypothetical protein